MLTCAIPQCGAQESSLRSGTLHLVDVVRRNGTTGKKMAWLCRACSEKFTVQTWRQPGQQIRVRTPSSALSPRDLILA